jgi:hypothetical protein
MTVTKINRVTQTKLILKWLKNSKLTVHIFSNKKVWIVDQAYNHRNDRYLSREASEVNPVARTKHLASVMMLGVVGSDRKVMVPYFFNVGLKINTPVYLDILQTIIKACINANYPDRKYVWQQNYALAHNSKIVQKYQHRCDLCRALT